jgi:hypothetical protein
MTAKVWKPLWMTLALLGSSAIVIACEEENPVEEAAEEVADEIDDATH